MGEVSNNDNFEDYDFIIKKLYYHIFYLYNIIFLRVWELKDKKFNSKKQRF